MTKDDIKDICLEGYLTGQKDILELMIEATKKTKTMGQMYVSLDEVLLVYNHLLEQLNDRISQKKYVDNIREQEKAVRDFINGYK